MSVHGDIPVPTVHAVSGPDMVMDRVDGPTMLKDLGTRPWMLRRHARTLAKLHRQLHGIPAPDWVPTYASHPAFATPDADTTSPTSIQSVEAGPVIPDALLHLDLHPDNVILSPSGPVVIDWRNTRRATAPSTLPRPGSSWRPRQCPTLASDGG